MVPAIDRKASTAVKSGFGGVLNFPEAGKKRRVPFRLAWNIWAPNSCKPLPTEPSLWVRGIRHQDECDRWMKILQAAFFWPQITKGLSMQMISKTMNASDARLYLHSLLALHADNLCWDVRVGLAVEMLVFVGLYTVQHKLNSNVWWHAVAWKKMIENSLKHNENTSVISNRMASAVAERQLSRSHWIPTMRALSPAAVLTTSNNSFLCKQNGWTIERGKC